MYKNKKFRIKSALDIISDIKKVKDYHTYADKLFLADGDALSIDTNELLTVLGYINRELPHIKSVGIYAHGKNLSDKSKEELLMLKDSGLEIIYLGLESGSDEVLEYIIKGITSDEIIEGLKKAKEVGLKTSVMIISGIGGKERYIDHAIKSAEALNKIQPDYISLLGLRIYENSPLIKEIEDGSFILLNELEVLKETRLIIENLNLENTIFRSNHASNSYPLKGTLGKDKEQLLKQLDFAIEISNKNMGPKKFSIEKTIM
jgi:radical SAM superfamily enzyme YgiQ (UPF0313 family)